MDGRRRHKKHFRAPTLFSERRVSPSCGVPESVCLVDDDEAVEWNRSCTATESFVRDNGCRHVSLAQRFVPHGAKCSRRGDQRSLMKFSGNSERDEGLTDSDRFREQRTAVRANERQQPRGGESLMGTKGDRPESRSHRLGIVNEQTGNGRARFRERREPIIHGDIHSMSGSTSSRETPNAWSDA